MAIFGPIWTQFRSKLLKICPESHFWSDRVDPIESIRSEMAFWPNFKLFRPKFSPNRTKNGHFSLKTWVYVTSEGEKNDYFRKWLSTSSIFESFSWIRVSHLLPHLFREIFANTKIPNIFRIIFEYGKKSVSSFAKHKNTEKKSFALLKYLSFLNFNFKVFSFQTNNFPSITKTKDGKFIEFYHLPHISPHLVS